MNMPISKVDTYSQYNSDSNKKPKQNEFINTSRILKSKAFAMTVMAGLVAAFVINQPPRDTFEKNEKEKSAEVSAPKFCKEKYKISVPNKKYKDTSAQSEEESLAKKVTSLVILSIFLFGFAKIMLEKNNSQKDDKQEQESLSI